MSADPKERSNGPDAVGEGPEVYRLAQSFSESAARALIEATLGSSVRTTQRNEVAGSHGVFFAETAEGEYVLRVATHPEHNLALELWAEAQARKAGVPVPEVLASVTDPPPGMPPFVIARRAPGEAAHTALLTPSDRAAVFEQLGRYAAKIHSVPIRRGFGELRRLQRGGCVGMDRSLADATQRDLMTLFGDLDRLTPTPLSRDHITELGLFHNVATRTALNRPHAVLVHGDFRFKNVLVESARVTAVLDFEMALAGDPAMDLAWTLHSDSRDEADREALLAGYEAEAPEGLGPRFEQRLAWYRLRYSLIELWWAASFGEPEPALHRMEERIQSLKAALHQPE